MILTTRDLEWPLMKCSPVAAYQCSVTGSTMLHILGEADSAVGGMFFVRCKACGKETKNAWIRDPMVYRFNSTCETKGCKEFNNETEFRLNTPHWSGSPH